jgi:hypothetical protein
VNIYHFRGNLFPDEINKIAYTFPCSLREALKIENPVKSGNRPDRGDPKKPNSRKKQ